MGPAFGARVTRGSALDHVVTDRRGGSQSLFDVTRLQQVPVAGRVMAPDPGETIGLELEPHRDGVGLGGTSPAARLFDAVGDAEQVLDVMAHFVRDHIGLGEVAGCAEPLLQFPKETQVDVDLAVVGAIERPHGGRSEAAGRLHGTGEEYERRFPVLAPSGRATRAAASDRYWLPAAVKTWFQVSSVSARTTDANSPS